MSFNTTSFGSLNDAINTLKNTLKETEKQVYIIEVEEIKRLVRKYDVILKDDIEENDLILKYETFYDQLNEYVFNKRKEIGDIEVNIENYSRFIKIENFTTVLNKKKDNTNQIINCINRIIERLKELEITIHINRINELNNMKIEKYDVDLEMDIINNSMDVLKQWSNKNTFNIIFDSKVDGDGSNNVLYDRVFNKSNLYFISFDGDNNVYGGYLHTEINDSCDYSDEYDCYGISDRNAFIFSLIRDGIVNNKKYLLKQDGNWVFLLLNNSSHNDSDGLLYVFGKDIGVCKVGSNRSWCNNNNNNNCRYKYNDDNKPLTDHTCPDKFTVQRIVVIEMNQLSYFY